MEWRVPFPKNQAGNSIPCRKPPLELEPLNGQKKQMGKIPPNFELWTAMEDDAEKSLSSAVLGSSKQYLNDHILDQEVIS